MPNFFGKVDFGIFYIATGHTYLQEAISSALISQAHSSLPIAICTDLVDEVPINLFTYIIPHPCPCYSYRDKITPLLLSPFISTLFLDTDAFLVHSPDALLLLLDSFEFAGAAAPVRIPPGWVDSSVPMCFPEINSGVLLYKKSRTGRKLIKRWLLLYDSLNSQFGQQWDQASLRSVLWSFIKNKSLRFFCLPPEFNLRTTKPWIAGRGSPVFVIHGRFDMDEAEKFIEYINSDTSKFRSSEIWLRSFPHSTICPKFDNS